MKFEKNIGKLLSCSYFKENIHFPNFSDESAKLVRKLFHSMI